MSRSAWFLLGLVGAVLSVGFLGCGPAGPITVPVKGTLTIDGKAADNVQITLAPLDASGQSASGQVKGGAFELFTGVQGKPGAVPGKYKVVLAQSGQTAEAAAAAYQKAGSGKGSAPPKVELSFPEKYTKAETSDKEVEIKSGSPEIKIDVPGK